MVHYHPETATESQAIAYKNADGDIIPLGGWGLLEPVEEGEPGEQSDLIEIVNNTHKTFMTLIYIEFLEYNVVSVILESENPTIRKLCHGRSYHA